MRIVPIRRSLLAAGTAAVAFSGLFAARLAAHPTGAGPDGRAPRTYRRAVRELGLTEDQQARVRSVLRAHADAIEAQIKAGAESRRALRAATLSDPFDEAAIRKLAARAGDVRADGAVLRARIRTEIWPILTSEQRQKARALGTLRGRRAARRFEALERWLRAEG